MSRQNPNNISQHPAKKWLEWKGDAGHLSFYNKETQANEDIPLPFDFVLLDRLSVIKGWHDASESGITSNEVRRTTDEPFVVRAFKMKDVIAQGFYGDIKDRVKAAGGRFNINLYIAYPNPDLEIASLMFRGAAMSAWLEFSNDKKNKSDLYTKGITITGNKKGKKGSVTFYTPVFEFTPIPKEMDDKAGELQKELQSYLTTYFARKTHSAGSQEQGEPEPEELLRNHISEDDGDIPF